MTSGTSDRRSNKRCYRDTEAHGEKWELSARNKHESPSTSPQQQDSPGFPNHSLHGCVSYCQGLSQLLVPCTHILAGHHCCVTVMGSGFPSTPVPRRNVELEDSINCPQIAPCWEKELRLTG